MYWNSFLKVTVLSCLASLCCMTSCSGNEPGSMDDPVPAIQIVRLSNGDFEQGTEGWTMSGAASVVSGGCVGAKALQMGSNADAQAHATGLDNGYYDLQFYAKSSGGQSAFYVKANDGMTSPQTSPGEWQTTFVRGIRVTDGTMTIQIHSEAPAEAVSLFDGFKLVRADSARTFLKGGDISELTYVEQNGGKYDENGKAADCLDILSGNGMNLVRLRLYNDPGNSAYSPSNRLPAGIEDKADILRLAKRAKDKGMQILLTFHYSDYWTNGEAQNVPHEWAGMNAAQLTDAVYTFTRDFMQQMKDQGTTPQYVSLGNETQAGMLYPYGSSDSIQNLADFYNAGYKAVKEVSPETRVIIHGDDAGDKEQYNWYFGLLRDYHVSYDIIGASYYPFWTNRDAATVMDWAEYTCNKFGKDLLFMETGYAWQKTIPDGSDGQLSHNNPYTDLSKRGQKNFLLELTNEIKRSPCNRILGYVYWDPIFIPAGNAGWELGAKNYVSNSALFGFDGSRNEALDAMKYNN